MNKRVFLLGVVLPIVMIGAWLARLAANFAGGEDLVLKIQGYDPRDILRGHYLQYRVDYGLTAREPTSPDTVTDACLCLEKDSDSVARGSWLGSCAERPTPTCSLYIRGRVEFREFLAGIERFYFPEVYQSVLATVPANATIKVRVARDGRAFVTGLFVGDEPVEAYARRRMQAQGASPPASEPLEGGEPL